MEKKSEMSKNPVKTVKKIEKIVKNVEKPGKAVKMWNTLDKTIKNVE